jgi:hypothetical protein
LGASSSPISAIWSRSCSNSGPRPEFPVLAEGQPAASRPPPPSYSLVALSCRCHGPRPRHRRQLPRAPSRRDPRPAAGSHASGFDSLRARRFRGVGVVLALGARAFPFPLPALGVHTTDHRPQTTASSASSSSRRQHPPGRGRGKQVTSCLLPLHCLTA